MKTKDKPQYMSTALRKIHLVLLVCFALSLSFSPEHIKLTSFITILLTANTIFWMVFSKEKKPVVSDSGIFIFLLVFVVCLLGLFKSENLPDGMGEIERKLSLFVFPLVFLFSPRLIRPEIKFVLLSFVLSCILSGLYCVLMAALHYKATGDPSRFFYQPLSKYVGMHAIYLSMYLCFCIGIVYHYFADKLKSFDSKRRLLLHLVFFILTVIIILLSGRITQLLLVAGVCAYVTCRLGRKGQFFRSLLGGVIIGAVLLGIALLFPVNRDRFKEAINYKGEYAFEKVGSGGRARPVIWSCALEIIADKPVLGVGTANLQSELTNCYGRHNEVFLTEAKGMSFNAHNQFLEVTVESGLLGLLVFIASVWISFNNALKRKKTLYLIFLIVFYVCCQTESLLERQSGVSFFAFFNSLLFLYETEEKEHNLI